MPRRLVVAGIVIMATGLALLAYLDPLIRILLFGQNGLGSATIINGGSTFTRVGTFTGNFTGGSNSLLGQGARQTTSVVSVATILVFVAIVIGLLLTIAGTFVSGKVLQTSAGPSPAAKLSEASVSENG